MKAVAYLLERVDIVDAAGWQDLKLWFPDETSYPGHDDVPSSPPGRHSRTARSS